MIGKRQRGFTLVELSLVMGFFSVLLIAILTLTIHIGKLYTKGMTTKSLNVVSRDITDAVRRDFAAADPTRVSGILMEGTTNKRGRICLGNVSYVWNTVGLLNTADPTTTAVKWADGTNVKFARIVDTAKSYCVMSGGVYPGTIPATATASDLLSGEDAVNRRDFAIYTLAIASVASSGSDGLYKLDFTIGTYDPQTTDSVGGVVICKPPTDMQANFQYCSVTELSMYVRTGGER
ncbi:hypothetical protein EOL96_03110 [Candidatus Saccharibacteria bacterium]|nr:hypothetical protein [Candidatus Saccharibacteria bacterium]